MGEGRFFALQRIEHPHQRGDLLSLQQSLKQSGEGQTSTQAHQRGARLAPVCVSAGQLLTGHTPLLACHCARSLETMPPLDVGKGGQLRRHLGRRRQKGDIPRARKAQLSTLELQLFVVQGSLTGE